MTFKCDLTSQEASLPQPLTTEDEGVRGKFRGPSYIGVSKVHVGSWCGSEAGTTLASSEEHDVLTLALLAWVLLDLTFWPPWSLM